MGSATAAHLAQRGSRVLGLERWQPGHAHGSSHGDSRIIREMYAEDPVYVPLVQRALALWRELEARSARPLLTMTGGLMVGPAQGELVQGTLRSAREHALAFEVLDAAAVRRRFPAFQPGDGMVAVWDPNAGHLDPEAGNAAHQALAREHGADLRFDEAVMSWASEGAGVRVSTAKGSYLADRLCLSVGAYLAPLLNAAPLPLAIERQVQFWFDPDPGDAAWNAPACPIWIHESAPGLMCYGFPRLARGVKASLMHGGETAARAEDLRREVHADEAAALRDAAGSLLPALRSARLVGQVACLFSNTSDFDFVIDFHPEHRQVLISSPCSGHGYKFASAIGEIQADLLLQGRSKFDLSPFRLARFGRGLPA